MNKLELSAIMQIVNKLGWNDMPASVALEAIQKMVNNDIAVGADCCGVIDDHEDALLSIATFRARNIWMRLFISDYETLHDDALEHWAITFRDKIETYMKLGNSFENSCRIAHIPSKEEAWRHYQESLAEMQESYYETIYSLKYSF